MADQGSRTDPQNWDTLTPQQVLHTLAYELYHPVSMLGSHLNRLVSEDDPLTEDDYEQIFEQMQDAVRQLSRTVVHLKQYAQAHAPPALPDADADAIAEA